MEHFRWLKTLLLAVTVLTVESSKIKVPQIINGDVAYLGQFPWQVGVVSVKSSSLNYCGGAIISESWVLTAAHCIYDSDEITIIYDTVDLGDTYAKLKVTKSYVVHEDYNLDTLNNDIGLVYLDSPLILGGSIGAIALAKDELPAGTEVTVAGWGSTADNDTSYKFDVLRYISVTTVENDKCVEAYGSTIVTDGVMCTFPGSPIKNPCVGDGGDPVVFYNDSPQHVGIFSFLSNFGCEDPDFPAGYTRTAYYREWIRDLTGV